MILEVSPDAMHFHTLPAGHPRTVLHLLSCIACREAAMSEMLSSDEPFNDREAPDTVQPRWNPGFDSAQPPALVAAEALPLDRAASSLAVPANEESRALITRLVDTLEQLPAESLTSRWKGRKYARPEVLASLLARGEGYLRTEPFQSERLGLVGLFLSGQINDDDRWLSGAEAWVPPGLVRSGLLVGASRRLLGKLKEAGQAFQHVSTFLVDDLEEAAYSREVALLRWQQGRSCDAAALLTQAAERFAEAGEPEREAGCWALLGLLRREDADPERAARALTPLLRSITALNSKARPMLALRVQLALVLCEAERGDFQQAHSLLDDAWTLVARAQATEAVSDPGLAFTWIEGRLADLESHSREAEKSLLQVRATMMAVGRLGEGSLASLDLALIAAHQGNLDRSESLADELAFRFKGEVGLVFALQALADFEESLLAKPKEARAAHALACRFLRQSFRAKGLSIEPPPFP